MKRLALILAAVFCGALAASCSREGVLEEGGEYSRVFIYCGLGYNDLCSSLETNFEDLCGGVLPELTRDLALVAYCHNTAAYGDYDTPNPPVLLRIYRDRGSARVDTLKVYPENTLSASASAIREMLLDVESLFPSESYGMLFSSHASGWKPEGYSSSGEVPLLSAQSATPRRELPLTKTLGAQYSGSSRNEREIFEIDIKDFAELIPVHLDYLIFDACLMGCVEVAWELRDVCDKLVFSPTEVLAQGFVYPSMSLNLLGGSEPDLEAVSREYFERYDSQSGDMRSATVTLVDCTKLDRLADVFAEIVGARRAALSSIGRDEVQKYFYYDNRYPFYYDLRDLAEKMAPGAELMSELDEALAECVPYHAETPCFFEDLLPLENCCGLSVYFPNSAWPELNAYYSTLRWNDAVHLVQ